MMTDIEWRLLRAMKDMLMELNTRSGSEVECQTKIREAFKEAAWERDLVNKAAAAAAEFLRKRNTPP